MTAKTKNAGGGVAAPTTGLNPTKHSNEGKVMYQGINKRKERIDAVMDGLAVVLGLVIIIGLGWWFLTNTFGTGVN